MKRDAINITSKWNNYLKQITLEGIRGSSGIILAEEVLKFKDSITPPPQSPANQRKPKQLHHLLNNRSMIEIIFPLLAHYFVSRSTQHGFISNSAISILGV
jgi:hypothetical protein